MLSRNPLIALIHSLNSDECVGLKLYRQLITNLKIEAICGTHFQTKLSNIG